MIRIFTILLTVTLVSACNLDVSDDFYFEKVAAYNIQTPSNLHLDENCEFTFEYHLPNGCYSFSDIEFLAVNDSVRVITPFAKVQNNVNCTQAIIDGSYTFRFRPSTPKTYIFKFWTGINSQGQNQYEEYEIETE